uniref:F-box domain-containing protein n=1 Tax=Romanomermis culicivorax TaxID=13658 RepID=A0A915LAW0_ROMCU
MLPVMIFTLELAFLPVFETRDPVPLTVTPILRLVQVSQSKLAFIEPVRPSSLLVAFNCGYKNKYLDESGVWKTDPDVRAFCLHGKLDVLKYCRKVYPHRNFTNIAELPELMSISNWCSSGFVLSNNSCHESFEVRPYLCITDDNNRKVSQKLRDNCQLDQSEDRNKCQTYRYWHDNAYRNCRIVFGENGVITVFNVLRACGLDLFSSYEYMCCDKNAKEITYTSDGSDEDQYDDESDVIKVDANQIISQWEELEAKFLKMNKTDSNKAKNFRIRMTERYRHTIANLMNLTKEERYRLSDVHEQRLLAAFHESFNDTNAKCNDIVRTSSVSNTRSSEFLGCYQNLIRSVEKYRVRSLNHFRHWLKRDPNRAKVLKSRIIHRLNENDVILNNSLTKINKLPNSIARKVKSSIDDFWQIFREEQAPNVDNRLLWIGDPSNTQRIVEFYEKKSLQDDEDSMTTKFNLAPEEKPQFETVQHAFLRRENLHRQTILTNQNIAHDRPTYAGYWLFTIAGLALLTLTVVAISVKRRPLVNRKSGFTVVDGSTPEERHVSGMQISGYVNPTYKYFDNQTLEYFTQKSKKYGRKINDLPDELLEFIFLCLSIESWHSSIRRVCSRWNRLVNRIFKTVDALCFDGNTVQISFCVNRINGKRPPFIERWIKMDSLEEELLFLRLLYTHRVETTLTPKIKG